MTAPADVSLRDLVLAWKALRPRDAATRAALARLLGHDLAPPRRTNARGVKTAPAPRAEPPVLTKDTSATAARAPAPAAARERLAPVAWETPSAAALGDAAALELAPSGGAAHPAPALAPLLEPRWTRDVLVHALSTDSPVGPVDLDRLVGLLARARPVLAIPRQPWPTVLRGVQVLVDIGDAMEPFAADQEELVARLRRVMGEGLTEVLFFRDCPARGAGPGPVWTWRPHQPARPGTPILLLSDLGAGGPALHPGRATAGEWLRFLGGLGPRAGHTVVLTPYRASRHPRALREAVAIVEWDRGTTPRLARLARRGRSARGRGR